MYSSYPQPTLQPSSVSLLAVEHPIARSAPLHLPLIRIQYFLATTISVELSIQSYRPLYRHGYRISCLTQSTPHRPVSRCVDPIISFLPELPLSPLAYAQPYLHHLNLHVLPVSRPPAPLLLCGVLIRPRLRQPTLSLTHRFLSKIYVDACTRYRWIASSFSVEPD